MKAPFPTNARWLDRFGPCVRCKRPSHGTLMSDRNAAIGPYCEGCARQAIANQSARAPSTIGKNNEPF